MENFEKYEAYEKWFIANPQSNYYSTVEIFNNRICIEKQYYCIDDSFIKSIVLSDLYNIDDIRESFANFQRHHIEDPECCPTVYNRIVYYERKQ